MTMDARVLALRIAIAQPTMHWSGDDNADAVLATLAAAAAQQARLCVFPELVIPGFHRQIAQWAKPPLVAAWLERIRAACAEHTVAAAIGAPTFDADGRIYNSHLLIDEAGRLAGTVHKTGLTDPESTFFARGDARPVVSLCGRRCTAVICREVEDLDQVCAQLAGEPPDIIFWPGLMGPEAGAEDIEPPQHVQQAQALARRMNAYLIQSNWPMSLNYPELGAQTGRSVVIDPSGEIAFELPRAQAGLAVFTLGQRRFDWGAQHA